MKRIRFIGDFYSGYDPGRKKSLLIKEKGVVEVSDKKADQLLRDFPHEFKELSWRPLVEKEVVEEIVEEKPVEEKKEEKKLEELKDKKLEELKNK